MPAAEPPLNGKSTLLAAKEMAVVGRPEKAGMPG
jgi:hypothetical protein